MSIYTREKIKLSLLLLAFIIVGRRAINIVFSSINTTLKDISNSQDHIISILETKQ